MYRFYSKDINFFVNEILVEMDDLGASTKFKGVVQSAKAFTKISCKPY